MLILIFVKFLLMISGIDINAKNKDNQTSFILANNNIHCEVVKYIQIVVVLKPKRKKKIVIQL